MQGMLSALKKAVCKGLYVLVLTVLLNVAGWLSIATHPSYAAPASNSSLDQTEQSVESREAEYEEAKAIANDRQKGIEREYEKNKEEFFEEHPEEGGVVQGAKNIVEKVTGNQN